MHCYLKPTSLPAKSSDFFEVDREQSCTANAWLIDPGLTNYRGHHYTLDAMLREAISHFSRNAEVLCHRNFPGELGFTPCFRSSIYYFTARSTLEVDEVSETLGNIFFEDLCLYLSNRVNRDDLLLIPSTNLPLLIGLHRWLNSFPEQQRLTKLQMHFHTLPTHGIHGKDAKARVNKRFVEEVLRFQKDFKVRWSANHARLADWYSRLCGVQFLSVRSPREVPRKKIKVSRQDGKLRFLFIGEGRREKGLGYILQALPGILSKTQICDFRFVLPEIGSDLLKQLPGRVSVRIEDGLPYEDYYDEIAHADFVLCVYDPEHYRFMNSGIAVEAALIGVGLVITKGMAVEDDILIPEKVLVLPDQRPESLEALCVALDKQVTEGSGASVRKSTPPARLTYARSQKMQDLTYITTCKGRLSHLQQSLPRIAEQPHVECVVVDYGCPERCGDWVEAHFQNVKVVRTGPTNGFNASHARNIGAAAARTPWLAFFDADILIDPTFSIRVVPALQVGSFYRSHHVTYQTWGSLICHRSDFERVGGYDETYAGWGSEDDDLIMFLLLHGVKQIGFPAALLSEIPHSDEQRTQFHMIKDRMVSHQINRMYFQVKLDLFRLSGTRLGRQEAIALYSGIQSELSTIGDKMGDGRTLNVTLPASLITSPPQGDFCQISELQRTLSYSLRVKGFVPNPGISPSKVDCI